MTLGAPSVLLLPGLDSDGSPSMTRYARELFTALSCLNGNSRAITLERPLQRRLVSAFFDHPQARRLDSAWCRYVAYPYSLKHREAGAYHVLDHGYAQLMRFLDAERTVVTCHDLIPLLAAEGAVPIHVPATIIRTFRMRIAYLARARTVITNSYATKATLERYTDVRSDRIVVVPYGVNSTFGVMPNARAARRASAGLVSGCPLVLQIATEGRYKNTRLLLEAFAQLRSRVAEAVLVRVGVPFYPDEAALAERLDLLRSIRYLGVIRDDQILAQWYNAADVLVFPSSWEGFGWPPLEAMACGTPVVASNVPAIAEIVGDAGLLVPADDASAVACATERVLTDAMLAASLRQKGLERASQYTWARTATRTAAVYDEILNSSD